MLFRKSPEFFGPTTLKVIDESFFRSAYSSQLSIDVDEIENKKRYRKDSHLLNLARETLGEDNVDELEPSMGGEDFGHFTAEIPGFFYRLGSVRAGGRSGGFHTPTFEADDGAIEVGMRAMAGIVMAYLRARA